MTPGTYRARKPAHGPVPFGLCTIGTTFMPRQDVRCTDCAHARRMTASAWRGCAAGHPPHRANEPHHCTDWQRAEVQP